MDYECYCDVRTLDPRRTEEEESGMKERPILFSAPMVRAILDGRKTMTRRIVKNKEIRGLCSREQWDAAKAHPSMQTPDFRFFGDHGPFSLPCPYGSPGDRLWVRETFSYFRTADNINYPVWYWADSNPHDGDWTKPKPSIHMPRWASRITLEVTAVRVERLNEISEEDAIAEGIKPHRKGGWHWETCGDGLKWSNHFGYRDARGAFAALWESINGAGSWDENPWAWCVSFRRTMK